MHSDPSKKFAETKWNMLIVPGVPGIHYGFVRDWPLVGFNGLHTAAILFFVFYFLHSLASEMPICTEPNHNHGDPSFDE